MEDIRDAARDAISKNQQQSRESLLNKNRKIENTKNFQKGSKEDVIKLANELKSKHVTSKLLFQLKEILLQDKSYAICFLEVDGALEALVKALSGLRFGRNLFGRISERKINNLQARPTCPLFKQQSYYENNTKCKSLKEMQTWQSPKRRKSQNAKLQIGAAYCLCNLSLGDKFLRILKTAGPYLLLHLEGMNTYLIEACVWTLGNLSSHHNKSVQLLKSQGALPLLSRLLSHNDDNIITASAYALSHFLYTGYDVLTPDDFRVLTEPVIAFFKAKPAQAAYLTSLLSSNPGCQLKFLQENIHTEALKFLSHSVKEDIVHTSWFIRIMGNLVPEETGHAALQLLNHKVRENNETLYNTVEYIVNSGQIFLIKECCWLLGNLMNHPNEEVSGLVAGSDIIGKIANPIRYLILGKETSG